MKRFIAQAKKSFTPPKSQSPTPPTANPTIPHTTGLQPKYVLPAVPHPCPHDHIALLVTTDGLLLRPSVHGLKHPASHVRIAWGKRVHVEELPGDGEAEGANWKESVVVYGIVGTLELFSGSYLLVITAKSDVGHFFDDTYAVYGVKGVTAIPLTEDSARMALNTLASRNATVSRPSLLPRSTTDSFVDPNSEGEESDHVPNAAAGSSRPHVQFSSEDHVRVLTPKRTHFGVIDQEDDGHDFSPSPLSSGTSTPSSDYSGTTTPVAKTLADRLSFWSRLSKRTSIPTVLTEQETLVEEHEALDAMVQENKEEPAAVLESILEATAPPPVSSAERRSELEAKIVKECIREFTKGGMYFAYNFDITRSLQHRQEQVAKSQKQHALFADLNILPKNEATSSPAPGDKVQGAFTEPYPTLPLWRRVDRRFWWNEWLSKPFVDAGLHSYVLPIMQGYYQIATFHIPIPREMSISNQEGGDRSASVDYVVISRRSRDRAGLRYQRRGIDDDAHVANFVETETIMRVEREGTSNVFSYIQIRGSIPLYWTQSGYALKPPPQISPDRTHAQNLDVLKRHFQRTMLQYGPHAIVNLAEQHGKEAAVTHGYRDYMLEADLKDAQYYEYDFHTETKGMKYENISKLIDTMERTFESQGYLWISDNTILSEQKGVFRVNCIDCLDRTNVVQSAFARYVLNKQLGAVALLNPSVEGRTETDIVFNDLWANNGDAISRAYAGTSALKGDFTRTGKRDLGGLLNDGVNSLARMYTSTFSDWFCQAVIDFMLGYRTLSVFSEFLLKLQSTDPRDLIRLSKIRAEAIATSVSRVLSEGERLISGWTLFAPEELNATIGEKFEEKVLLLTARALYIISYDYTLEKVKIYTRVPLSDIISITKGAYILSPLEEASRDPNQNAGFIVSWLNGNQVTRVTSYSVRNSLEIPVSPSRLSSAAAPKPPARRSGSASTTRALSRLLNTASLAARSDTAFAAFKVLPIDPARERASSSSSGTYAEAADELSGASSCREAAGLIVDAIRRACEDAGGRRGGLVLSDGDVVSLAEAQKMTSVYAKMEYGVKRLLWLGG